MSRDPKGVATDLLQLTADEERSAAEAHRHAIVVDMLQGGMMASPAPVQDGKTIIDRALEAGVAASFQTVAAAATNFWGAIDKINRSWRLVEARGHEVMVVRTSEDVRRAKRDRKVGLVLGFQNAEPLENDWVPRLPVFYRLGVRWICPTYNERNLLGSGCLEPRDDGLTYYGRQIVKAMSYYGIILDLSHTGDRTSMEALEVSDDPPIVTHANPRARTGHPRNKTDEFMKALAERGGVMGLSAWGPICITERGQTPTINHFLDHVDYAVDLIGVDHVGFGMDLAEVLRTVPGWSDFEARYPMMREEFPDDIVNAPLGLHDGGDIPNITRGLTKRGYSSDDVAKIMGGNVLRVAATVWDRAVGRGW